MQGKSPTISFLGAAENVTGSRHLLQVNGLNILVDCGLYQERNLQDRNWDEFPIPPNTIDAVLLTHAHLDHCGLIPKLAKEGFQGKIYCTTATAEIAKIVMQDCGHLLEEDAVFKRKRHKREGRESPRPIEPLYTSDDALACFELFTTVKYKQVIKMDHNVEVAFCNAGHILGSSVIKVKFLLNGDTRTILFSGDIGRNDRPIIKDPEALNEADYIVIESTYGDRTHETIEDTKIKLADAVNSAIAAGGNIIVPSFAIERSQEILYYLNELQLENLISPMRIFLDSPMAVRVTDVFKHHPEMFDEEMSDHMKNHESPFDFPGLKMVRTTRESKAINKIKETIMIIAGSGMCTGGRIKHHLVNHIWRPENTLLFVGYQAVGTLGRQIVEGTEEVRILGQTYKVKARIVQALGFSAHADKNELLEWLSGLEKAPKHVFVVHGETNAAHYFAKYITEQKGWNASVPHYNDTVKLD